MKAVAAVVLTLSIDVLMTLVYLGWGNIATYILKIERPGRATILPAIWLGWAISLWVLQVIHLFLPISALTVTPLIITGIAFCLVPAWKKIGRIKIRWSRFGVLFWVAMVILAVWVALRAMLQAVNYDSGLYHYDAIHWINSYAIVPGLGNLHARLAFNQSFFTYVAALNFYPFFGHGDSLAISYLFLLAFATAFECLRPLFQRPALLLKTHPFFYAPPVLVLPVLAFLTVYSRELTSPTPDLASTLLQIVLFVLLARGISRWARSETWPDLELMALVILAATGVTVKLSNLVFSAVTAGFCLIYAWREAKAKINNLVRLSLPAFAILGVWCLRGVILSGAPLYPSLIGYIPLDWAMPANAIDVQAKMIFAWGRLPHVPWSEVLSNWDWLGPWSQVAVKDTVGVMYPLLAGLVFMGLAGGTALYGAFRRHSGFRALEWSLLLVTMASLAYWFLTAPDIRFANGLFWLLAYSAGLLALVGFQTLLPGRMYAVAMVVVFLGANFLVSKYAVGKYSFKDISLSGWQKVISYPLQEKMTDSGLLVYTPAQGDQCGEAPLPCTPSFSTRLRLRVPGNLGGGFTLQKDP